MSLFERLSHRETLERALAMKRINLIEDLRISDRPVLIWQCLPSEPLSTEVTTESVKNVIRDGASEIGDNGWWHSFHAYGRAPVLVFDGVAARTGNDHQWTTEFHGDGHFIAACWAFIEFSDKDSSRHGIVDFYTDAYRDFGHVAQKLYEAISYEGELQITCTLAHANELPMVNPGRHVVGTVNRSQLRWPIHTATSPSTLQGVCQDMAAQLMRAYGRNFRKS